MTWPRTCKDICQEMLVVICTGYSEQVDLLRALEYGIDGVTRYQGSAWDIGAYEHHKSFEFGDILPASK